MKCPHLHTYDFAQTAALCSQLAGVLAGFAFFAIIFVLTSVASRSRKERQDRSRDVLTSVGRRSRREREARVRDEGHVLVALTGALISLITSPLLYAILADERGTALVAGRATSEELLSGVSFTFAVLALLYAILLLISESASVSASRQSRLVVSVLGPPLAVLFLVFGAELALGGGLRPGTSCDRAATR